MGVTFNPNFDRLFDRATRLYEDWSMLSRFETLSAFYANPTRFMRLAGRLTKPLWARAQSGLVSRPAKRMKRVGLA